MTLVDTSVWIDWLADRTSVAVTALDSILAEGEVLLAPVILQEILQGARTMQSLKTLRERFAQMPILEAQVLTHIEAGTLYARCRWQGITPRSPHDCLIAQLAIENRIPLLHADRDFEAIASIDARLILTRGLSG